MLGVPERILEYPPPPVQRAFLHAIPDDFNRVPAQHAARGMMIHPTLAMRGVLIHREARLYRTIVHDLLLDLLHR